MNKKWILAAVVGLPLAAGSVLSGSPQTQTANPTMPPAQERCVGADDCNRCWNNCWHSDKASLLRECRPSRCCR